DALDLNHFSNISGNQNVTSYFLADKVRTNTNAMAAAGGTGTAFPLGDPQAVLKTLRLIFGDILSVSTTFVAASVPTNVFDRAKAVDNIFFALFQAEAEPRWNGNVKKLRVAPLTITDPQDPFFGASVPIIAQANAFGELDDPPVRAISATDGRILDDALTFWTDPAGEGVTPAGCTDGTLPLEPTEFCGTDGRSITRGGAGQNITGYLGGAVGTDNSGSNRQVFTEDPNTPGVGLGLDTTMDLTNLLDYLDPNSTLDPIDEVATIGWIRGIDTYDADADSDVTDNRPWLMSDPMHSRPLVVNYGVRPEEAGSRDPNNPEIYLFFGTNDGVVHFVKNTESDGNESGQEVRAFVPLEMLGMQNTLARNFAQSAPPHPYGMDGEAVSYVYDADRDGNVEAGDNDYAMVFIGQRRGGKGYYAFDVTNPAAPAFKWKITNQTPGFEQLALTFSTPVATTLDLGDTLGGDDDGDADTPVLIFAGGYNGGWSGTSRVGKDLGDADDTVGNAIYVVNALTGDLIWRAIGPGAAVCTDDDDTHCVAAMVDSIPTALAVIDSDNNNVVDRAYVGDTGGNIWRVELTEFKYKVTGTELRDDDNWYVTQLARLGGSGANDRRFFHAPDYVKARVTATGASYDGVIITSGDRAHPKGTATQDYAFMIKDSFITTNANSAVLKDRAPFVIDNPTESIPTGLFDITDACLTGEETACTGADITNGWKLKLEADGEKGLSRPLTTNGVVLFTTYLPNKGTAAEVCEPSEGSGRVYLVNLSDGSPAFDLAAEIGVIDKADRWSDIGPGIPGDVIPYEDYVLIPGKGIGGRQIYNIKGRSLWRVYWKEEGVDQ
ncbi:MAG: hypothetical protein V7700_14980, partial [Halioglobus sp.]